MNLGICLSGVEDQFERALRERAKDGQPFTYLEIGVAHCETWLAVCLFLGWTEADWRTIGIDPSPDALDAYKLRIEPEFGPDKALLLVQTREEAFEMEKFCGEQHSRSKRIGNRLDFVFLDGCHSKQCVIGDFLAVEPLVIPGGLVVCHDLEDVVGDIQVHCNAERGVCEGLQELGLLTETCGDCDPCIGGRPDQCAISPSRKGWKRLPDWTCDKTKNAFSCACFEKL